MSSGTFNLGLNPDQSPQIVSSHDQIKQACDNIFLGLLGDVERRLLDAGSDQDVANAALDDLFNTLRDRKNTLPEDEWRQCVATCRAHAVTALVHQDPFTFRAFSKPRGYAGDAVMMDYIYGREEHWSPPTTTPIGHLVYNFTTAAPASEGVRSRRAAVASIIDRLAEERSRPHILAIASGHMREANLSQALRRQRTGRFVALDADAQSLAEVNASYGRYGVETVAASFRNLLTNKSRNGQFDLVYSTGLFDYLAQNTGRRLVQTMFEMLRPGGSLVVANFLPAVRDIGYMETYMDWNLIYRSRHEMVDLTADIPENEIRHVNLWSEEAQNIIFVRVTRN